MLRERGLGNAASRLIKQLQEQHSEHWLGLTAEYLTECDRFLMMPGFLSPTFKEPPTLKILPTYKWLLAAYTQDILVRLDEVKAKVTSTYGSVLKMDSTKKVII